MMTIYICTIPGIGGVDGFTAVQNSLAVGGIPNNAQSIEACKQQCLSSATRCFSFDYNAVEATKCYLHFTETSTLPAPGVTHYVRFSGGKLFSKSS